jgi:hypothetical protein
MEKKFENNTIDNDAQDPLLLRIRSRITEWKKSKPNISIGSVRAVNTFITFLDFLIDQYTSESMSPSSVAEILIQSKLKLNLLVQYRVFNRLLVESMIVAEYLMHESIDYFLSHPDCGQDSRIDFRFNWAPLIYCEHKDTEPIYLSQYGVESMLRKLVTIQ